MSIIVQQTATIHNLLYFCKLLYLFRVVTPPIIRSTYNCNYSIWHWSNFGKCSVWSQLKISVMLLRVSMYFTLSSETFIINDLKINNSHKTDTSRFLSNEHTATNLTFKNRASYVRVYGTGVPLPSKFCILYIFSTNINTKYFKDAAHTPFFSSKCRLFHNATFFGSYIIHILHIGCAKI
jgi:hypothetical protein